MYVWQYNLNIPTLYNYFVDIICLANSIVDVLSSDSTTQYFGMYITIKLYKPFCLVVIIIILITELIILAN